MTIARPVLIALLLAASPAAALDRAVADAVPDIVADVSATIFSKVAWNGTATGRQTHTVALSFLKKGVPPFDPGCTARLTPKFVEQIGKIAERGGVPVGVTDQTDSATVNFVVGDTLELRRNKTGELPLEGWLAAARQAHPASVVSGVNLGIPGDFPTNWVEGVFGKADHRLIYGYGMIHWQGLSQNLAGKDIVCSFNFVEHLIWLYAQGLEDDISAFRETYDPVVQRAWTRVGITGWNDTARAVQNVIYGAFMCAQFVDRSHLASCSRQLAEITEESYD